MVCWRRKNSGLNLGGDGSRKNVYSAEATFKCGKKSQIMRYRTCRKWRIVRSCAAEFFELCCKCAVNLIELCDYYAVNHGIVQKCAVDKLDFKA